MTSTARVCAIPAQTPAITRSSELGAKLDRNMPGHRRARSTRTEPRPACAVDHEDAGPGLDDVALDVAPVAADAAGEIDLADLGRAVRPHGHAGRDEHAEITDVDVRLMWVSPTRDLQLPEVEVERADAELVVARQVLRRS